MIPSYIWPLFNRISHILLILFFTICYVLADFDKLLDYHASFGLAIGVVFIFRVIWGYIGPKYSRFQDFCFDKKELVQYLLNPFSKTKQYIGHNPASSYAIVAMIVLAFLAIISGMLTYGIEENHGLFSFLHSEYLKEKEIIKELHELFSNLFLAVIIIHIIGALVDKFIKKSDAINSMIKGYKNTTVDESVKVNIFQTMLGFIFIAITILVLFYLLFMENIFIG